MQWPSVFELYRSKYLSYCVLCIFTTVLVWGIGISPVSGTKSLEDGGDVTDVIRKGY